MNLDKNHWPKEQKNNQQIRNPKEANKKEKQSELQKRNNRIGKTKEKRKKKKKKQKMLQKSKTNVTKKKHPLISIKRPKKIIQENHKSDLITWNNNKKSHQKSTSHLTNTQQKNKPLKTQPSKNPHQNKALPKNSTSCNAY